MWYVLSLLGIVPVLIVYSSWYCRESDEIEGSASLHEEVPRYPRQLTHHGKDDHALWSPDGKTIAFRSLRNTYNPEASMNFSEVWVVGADGTEERPLISVDDPYFGDFLQVSLLSWFPDSQSVLCRAYGNTQELWRVFLDGRRELLVAAGAREWIGDAAPSPDGAKLAFVLGCYEEPDERTINHLYVADQDGRDRARLAEGFFHGLTWTPDGTHIICCRHSREEENSDLWEVSIDGSETIRLSRTPQDEKRPSCSPDGNSIVYHVDEGHRVVYVTPRSTFEPRKLLVSGRGTGVRHRGWMSDSRHILVIRGSGSDPHDADEYPPGSWIIDLQGNLAKLLGHGDGAAQCLAPNGREYCYTVRTELDTEPPWSGPVRDWERNLWVGKLELEAR